MGLFKKLVIALSLCTAMLAVAPSVMAKPAGKIENQKPAATKIAIGAAIEQAEITLAAAIAGGDVKDVLVEFKKTKQIAKTNESATTYRLREKALGYVSKARSAYKKGKQDEAVAKMTKAVETFKEIEGAYKAFME
ncbi:MAG: hypothetical protein Q9M50_05405 [Methylococcales bacterium]|nr:hypothetical protein [Methylococcales bacterium]